MDLTFSQYSSAVVKEVSNELKIYLNNYDNVLDKIFEIQTEVSKDIANALEITLSDNEQDRLENSPTNNSDAYMAYKQGQMFLNRGGAISNRLKSRNPLLARRHK